MTRSVLITGASTGIGRAAAKWLVARGFTVFAGVRKPSDAEALRSDGCVPVILDVADEASVVAAKNVVEATLGAAPLYALVNNAGIAKGGPLEYLPIDEVKQVFEVNVFGTLRVTQTFLPLLRRGPSRIVNIGSTAGKIAAPFLSPYAMSKHALEAMSDAMRQELLPFGIHVCLLRPGAIQTPIWEKGETSAQALKSSLPDEAHARYGGRLLQLNRFLQESGRHGASVDTTSRAIEHALVSEHPKARYAVGLEAKITLLVRWLLPDRWIDGLLRWVNGRGDRQG